MGLDTHITYERKDMNPVINDTLPNFPFYFHWSLEKSYTNILTKLDRFESGLCSLQPVLTHTVLRIHLTHYSYFPWNIPHHSQHSYLCIKGAQWASPDTPAPTEAASGTLLFTNATSSKSNTQHSHRISLVTRSGLTFYKRRSYISIEWQVCVTSDSFHRILAYLDLTVILNPLQVHRTNTITLILEARKPKSTDINELLWELECKIKSKSKSNLIFYVWIPRSLLKCWYLLSGL